MAIVHALAVIVIVLLGVLTVAIFVAVIAATVLVTGAVHREERHRTLTGPAPGPCTRLARWLLAVPEVRDVDDSGPDSGTDERPAWYERTGGPSR
jgi:hypothetical protein